MGIPGVGRGVSGLGEGGIGKDQAQEGVGLVVAQHAIF